MFKNVYFIAQQNGYEKMKDSKPLFSLVNKLGIGSERLDCIVCFNRSISIYTTIDYLNYAGYIMYWMAKKLCYCCAAALLVKLHCS